MALFRTNAQLLMTTRTPISEKKIGPPYWSPF